MGLFKKKDRVVDLTGYYEKNKERIDNMKTESMQKPDYEEIKLKGSSEPTSPEIETAITPSTSTPSSSGSSNGFFGGFFGGGSSSTPNVNPEQSFPGSESVNPDEKRRKLAKRLGDMTSKIEDLSNQIYHLQQRLEVAERKLDVNRF